jgi:hypothetical protein
MAMKQLRQAKRWQAVLVVLMVAAIFYSTRPAMTCGPFTARAVFSYDSHPDIPLTRFAAGELGVLKPTYARSYLIVAYRYFTGAGLDRDEQKAALAVWDDRLSFIWDNKTEDWTKQWSETLGKVPGMTAPANQDVFRSEDRKDYFVNFLNCPQDAFRNAAETLNKLIAKYGAASPEVKDFAETQVKVFAGCSEGKALPDAAPANASPTIKANRSYQIAAANFYAENFAAAEKQFTAIAADSSSPWRPIAPYLVARTLIRKATLTGGQGKVDTAALTQAEAQLKKVLADKNESPLHNSARGLLGYVRFRLNPEARLPELAAAVTKKGAGASLRQDLIDYTLLLDHFVGDGDDSNDKEKTFAALPKVGREDDMTDWVLVFQVPDQEALEYAVKKWEKVGSLPWLAAALTKVHAGHPKATALIEAAAKVKPNSPAFASVAYHGLRVMIEAGRKDDARKQLDALLATTSASLVPSALNQFLALRMKVAANLDEFLKYATRVPSGVTFDEDGRELPMDKDEGSDEVKNSPRLRAAWDADATRVLNEMMPLGVLKEAANSKTLPAHLRRELAIATWVRAALLDDEQTATALAPTVINLAPELKAEITAYVAATDAPSKKFAAVYLVLKYPGARPSVDSSMGRLTDFSKIDDYRDNWWCAYGQKPATDDDTTPKKPKEQISPPDFLTAEQKAAAVAEWKKLVALGTGPNYLSLQAIKWATVKPADPRAPEALHLAVRSTRYGCTDEQTGRLSKQAYDVLHQKYPKSEWAQKTKYWFKN